MLHRSFLLAFLAALAMSAAPAQAQFALNVHDSVRVIRGELNVNLKVTISNVSFRDIDVRATRIENTMPAGSTWFTAMCFGDLCYPPDLDTTPAAHIVVDDSTEFKLSVGVEAAPPTLDTVRVVIRFDTGPLSNFVTQEFLVISEPTSGASDENTRTVRIVRPNPARTSAIIPLGEDMRAAAGMRLQLVDALGRTVADLRDITPSADGVAVDVSAIADGAYFYRLDADGRSRTGRLVVAH